MEAAQGGEWTDNVGDERFETVRGPVPVVPDRVQSSGTALAADLPDLRGAGVRWARCKHQKGISTSPKQKPKVGILT